MLSAFFLQSPSSKYQDWHRNHPAKHFCASYAAVAALQSAVSFEWANVVLIFRILDSKCPVCSVLEVAARTDPLGGHRRIGGRPHDFGIAFSHGGIWMVLALNNSWPTEGMLFIFCGRRSREIPRDPPAKA